MDKIQPQMLVALEVVRQEFNQYSLDTVITAGSDGQHMANSLHYKGLALDFRTKHAAGAANGIYVNIKAALAPLGFDVLFEGKDTPNEHLHCEYQPK